MMHREQMDEMLEIIKSEISSNSFNIWFKNTTFELADNNRLIIYVANEFASDWVRKNYLKLLHSTSEKVLGKKVEVFISSEKTE